MKILKPQPIKFFGKCDLCGENKITRWASELPLNLCRGCELSNVYEDEQWEKSLANDEYREYLQRIKRRQ